jgi:hypothetical protein
MRQRRRRPSGRLGQEEERAEHKPPGAVSWLVLSPFLLLPAREARAALTPSRAHGLIGVRLCLAQCLRAFAMMVSRALRPLASR